MLAFLLLSLLAATVKADSLLPGFISSSYATTVEINFSHLGYTLSYDEYWWNAQQTLRTDGRYLGRNVIELTTFGSKINNRTRDSIKIIDRSEGADQECRGFYLQGGQNNSLMYQPSLAVWELLNFTGFSWTNIGYDSMGDRQMNATHFISPVYTITNDDRFCYGTSCANGDSGLETPDWDVLELIDFSYGTDSNRYDTTFNMSYYVNKVSNSVTIPLRLVVEGTRTNIVTQQVIPFSNNYDWVNFRRLDTTIISTITNTYRRCAPNATEAHYYPPFPTSNTVAAPYTIGQAPPASMFPNEMYMVYEGMDRDRFVNGTYTAGGNTAYTWMLDDFGNQEAVAVQPAFEQAETKTIYRYNNADTHPISGRVYTITHSPRTNQYSCTTANLTAWGFNPNTSPTRYSRTGGAGASISDFFVDPSFGPAQFRYVGRTTVRSVPTDTWQATFTGQTGWNNSLTYTYTSTVYSMPMGWQFPGRAQRQDQGLPILIANQGTANGVGGPGNQPFSFNYRDTWNIFSLIPADAPDSSWWTEVPELAPYRCSAYPPSTNPVRPTPPAVRIPYFSPDYHVTVEQTYSDVGMTISYEEFSQYSRGLLRADGRYMGRSVVEITDWNRYPAVMTQYDSLDGSCQTYQLDEAAQRNSLIYLPSSFILTMMNYTGLNWAVQNNAQLSDRNIAATRYSVSNITIGPDGTFCNGKYECSGENGVFPNTDWSFIELLDPSLSKSQHVGQTQDPNMPTYSYVIALQLYTQTQRRAGLVGAIPLRLIVTGKRFMVSGDPDPSGESFTNIVDWVDWRSVDLTAISAITDSASYRKPCLERGSYTRTTFPNATNVGESVIPLGSAPLGKMFPNQFVMQMEAQLRAGRGGGNYAIRWSYDAPSLQESVSTAGNNYSGAAYPTTFLYNWNGDYEGGVAVWQVDGPLNGQTCVARTEGLTNITTNPLQSSHGGRASFLNLWKGAGEDWNAFRYTGRTRNPVRGVQADVYQASFVDLPATDSSVGANMVFSYNVTIYTYPEGWSMIGRDTAADMKLPFRVIFNGNQRNTNTNRVVATFNDMYNLFELFPASDVMRVGTSGQVDSIWYPDSPSNFQCPAYPKRSSSKLGGGAVAGIVIGVLLGVALLIAGCCYLNRAGMGMALSKKLGSDESTGKWKKQHDDSASEMTEI